ncbi:MAG: protein kinase [Deltaproteobacteria bacterium]|nr:protein kinase [Deltaproteobacteria bacterium]
MVSASRAPDLPAPFGKYLLCERIGKGGMAEIFRATVHGASGFLKELVIKRMLPSLTNDPSFAEVIVREAKIAVTLRHQNIVQVFELGEVEGQYYIAMEYIHGRDLRAVLARCSETGKSFPMGLAVHIALEVCRALDYAHGVKGPSGRPLELVHRDISPTNLMASFAGEIKVLDFGIAKAEVADYVTREGLIKGNCPYMSPEQIAGKPVNHQSDLFSLGSTLYEILTGRRAFEAPTQIAIMQRIYAEPCEPPSHWRAEIPGALDDAVMKLLAKDPAERCPDAAAAHDSLVSVIGKGVPPSSSFELSTFLDELYGEETSRESRSLPPEGHTQQSRGIIAAAQDDSKPLLDGPEELYGSTKPMPLRPGATPTSAQAAVLPSAPEERKRTSTRPLDDQARSPAAGPTPPGGIRVSDEPTDTRRIEDLPAAEARASSARMEATAEHPGAPAQPAQAPRTVRGRWPWIAGAVAVALIALWQVVPRLSGPAQTEYRPRPDRTEPRATSRAEKRAPVTEPLRVGSPAADAGVPVPSPSKGEKRPPSKVVSHVRPPGAMGLLRLSCEPWADVTIDGRRIPKQTPLVDYPIPAGVRALTLTHPGYRPERLTIRVAPNETVFRRVVLERVE